jgi:hypothetical protein
MKKTGMFITTLISVFTIASISLFWGVDSTNAQVNQRRDQIQKNERMLRHRQDLEQRRSTAETLYNQKKPISRDSGVKPYLYDHETYPEMMYRDSGGPKPYLENSYPEMMQRRQ